MKRGAAIAVITVVCLFTPQTPVAADLHLGEDGTTSYRIVLPEDATAVDQYAVDTLAGYLEEITGAAFPVVEPGEVGDPQECIFVGMSEPARSILGEDPLADLEDEEHVARSIDSNIFLYGKGIHGNLWAVMEFAENSLGWRWYSVHEEPVLPSRPTLTLKPFDRTRDFTFGYREVQHRFDADFYYQNAINMGYARRRLTDVGQYQSRLPTTKFVHTPLAYIPPTPDNRHADDFEWQDRKNYFETNPEFFSMNKAGERVPTQLCFSNPQLREELTRNVFRDIEHARPIADHGLIVTIDAADTPGKFCHCPDCEALEQEYQNPGGPILDYLIELCGQLKDQYPNVMVRTLAYRRSQTQHPIVLPEGEKLPDNLIVSFAPIEDCYFGDWWNHRDADIQGTYHDLLGWSEIAPNLWAWMYPNPGGTGAVMPVGNIERIINNMRLMEYAGLSGAFTDHGGVTQRSGFAELQSYVILKMMQDVNCDTDTLIREFTNHHYGEAGALMRQYIDELEEARKQMELPPNVRYTSTLYNERTFPYLTTENIHRWQTYFDRMEELTADHPDERLHVQKERRELDFATLWQWWDLTEEYPQYFEDYTVCSQRIRDTNEALTEGTGVRPFGENELEEFELKLEAGKREAPLPRQLEGVDESRIRQFVPLSYRRDPRIIADPDAAFGYAAPVDRPGYPFACGFYQWKSRHPRSVVEGPSLELEKERITPGVYTVYELGEINVVTPDSLIWMGRSWATHLEVGSRFYRADEESRWDAYVSLKFEGEEYGGTGDEMRVFCDRIILVEK